MKLIPRLPTRHEKWGLTALLIGALGFSLSMNPEHGGSIARHQVNYQTLDLAATSPHEILVSGKSGSYKATLFEVNNVTFAKFESLSNSEGTLCELCQKKAVPLQASISQLNELNKELLSLVNTTSENQKNTSAQQKNATPAKKGELTEVDLEQWASKCEKSSEDTKLSCHKDRLIELSKALKNTSETESLMKDYFNMYLQADLKRGLTGRTIKEVSAASCSGQIIYPGAFGRVGCYTEDLQNANEMTEDLMSSMRAGNSRLVVQALTKLRAASFSAQMRNSQTLAIEGRNENNMAKFNLGFRGMDPNSLQWIFQQTHSSMLDSVQSMDGSNRQKSDLELLIQNHYENPVYSLLKDMRLYLSGNNGSLGNNQQPGRTRNLLDYQISSIADERGVPTYGNDPSYTPGYPGSNSSIVNVNPALRSRLSAPVRGSNGLYNQAPWTRNTTTTQPITMGQPMYQNPSQNQYLTQQNLAPQGRATTNSRAR